MKISNKYINKFKEVLKQEKLKFTDQRFIIFKTLYENDDHFSPDDIKQLLSRKNINISRATIYRTLDILVKYNLARRLLLDDGISRYENKLSKNLHDHMICIESGQIIEFYNEELENLQERIAKDYGYTIIKHVHQLFVKKNK